ncbi:tyrosine-type recombinase/integrase [Salicibibacter kimchii]|uniref:Integrase n=1 Tax=Salicibibacter kimchii TaxID=2099786 RepID=A0A345BUK0_9BACI|nr:tyrosine-type recombinase/integrase [Salicibibacter kimchii]AXF54631.1 integrase [Salicibibacter kimchii]
MKLTDVWVEYEADKKIENYSENTLDSYYLQWRLLIEEIGDIDIDTLKIHVLKSYIAKSYGELKPSTIAHRVKSIRTILEWAHDEGITETNIGAKLKKPREEQRIPKALTVEEIERLRIACRNTTENAVLEFFYSTGCRINEVYELNVNDIDLAERTVIVRGKGNVERVVMHGKRAAFWINKYLREREDNEPAFLVTQRKPIRRMSKDNMRYIFKRMSERAEIDKPVYPHRFRHSFSTHLLERGATIEEIQQFLGHTDISTTMIYSSVSNDRLKHVHNKAF